MDRIDALAVLVGALAQALLWAAAGVALARGETGQGQGPGPSDWVEVIAQARKEGK